MDAATFEERLQAVATARSWPESVLQVVRESRVELAASPEATAIRIARRFGLQGFDESLLSQLHQGRELPLGTVWSPLEPTNEAPTATPQPAEKVRTLTPTTEVVASTEGERTIRAPTLAATEPTIETARALLAMVARAHELGVVLRNLAPGNLLVGPLGEVLLTDPTASPVPANTSPEQAAGEALSPASDVFALGTLLFEWFGAASLFGQVGASETLAAVREDRRREPRLPLPPRIATVVERATQVRPEKRYRDARAMLRALSSDSTTAERLAAADATRERARSLEASTESTCHEEASRLRFEARVLEHRALFDAIAAGDGRALRNSHARLRSDPEAFTRALVQTAEALGVNRPGRGRLHLHTVRPATVDLYRYELRGGRQWPEPLGSLGEAPIDVRLAPGSYVAVLHPESGPDVRYPIWIDHYGHWSGTRRGGDTPVPIELPDAKHANQHYVPGGWARLGRPTDWVWVDGFFINRHPVSTGDYLAFLDQLSASGRGERAQALAPPHTSYRETGWRIEGWDLDWPVTGVPFEGAVAFAKWRRALDDLPWSLPTGAQWEKAARGADGRRFPWGEASGPTFACYRSTAPVQSPTLAVDASPYGVRGMGGNVRDWVLDPAVEGFAYARGGCFAGEPDDLETWRTHLVQASGSPLVGFRLVRPL